MANVEYKHVKCPECGRYIATAQYNDTVDQLLVNCEGCGYVYSACIENGDEWNTVVRGYETMHTRVQPHLGMESKKIMKGDIITLAEQGELDLIVHGCNCFGVMGAGLARQMKERYPIAFKTDANNTAKGDKTKLGGYTWCEIAMPSGHKFIIVNAYTQYRYGTKGRADVNYGAIRSVFNLLGTVYPYKRIGYPKIGCGLAGGEWHIVKDIIDKELKGLNHVLVTMEG